MNRKSRTWLLTPPILVSATALGASLWLFLAPIGVPSADIVDADLAAVPEFSTKAPGAAESHAAAILARPLFSEGRRAELSEEGGHKALGELRLAGTIATPRIRKALFREAALGTSKGIWVTAGGEIAGWRIMLIEPGRVALQRGGEQLTLSISKQRALTPKQASQARAATPILSSGSLTQTPAEIESRQEKLSEALSRLGADGFYGTSDQ